MKLIFTALAVLCCISTSYAGFVPTYDLPTLVNDADNIVVGKIGEVKPLGTATLETGGTDDKGQKKIVVVQLNQATLEITATLKGNIAGRVFLSYPVPSSKLEEADLPTAVFPQISENSKLLIFLDKTPVDGHYAITHPLNYYGSATPLSSPELPDLQEASSPLRKVLLLLAHEASNSKGKEIIATLERIKQVGYLLYIPLEYSSNFNYSYDQAMLRKSLEEENLELENWVSKNIAPKIEALLQNPAPQVQRQVLLTAASLQDANMLSQIVNLAQTENPQVSQEASLALRQYRTPQAIKGLIETLQKPQLLLRQEATFALSSIDDNAIAPILLKLLDDPNDQINGYALQGLISLFGDKGPQIETNRTLSQSKYIQLWKDWAIANAPIIQKAQERLQTQFLK